jgi:hypothetical protein
MKILINEKTDEKLHKVFQRLIDKELSEIKTRYREEEISARNWYLSKFSHINNVDVVNIKYEPGFSVFIDVYADLNFDEDNVQDFANYLREKLSYAGNPWIVPKLFNNKKSINEDIKRDWMDQEYEEIFDKTKKNVIKTLSRKIKAYSEDDERIVLYGDEDGNDRLMDYRKKSKELFFNKSLSNFYEKVLPHPLWYVNGKYYVYDTFKELFPDVQVNRVTSANIG